MQDQPNVKLMRWADELSPLYDANGNHILDMDDCGVDVFGIVNYACHMIAWTNTADGVRYWVPRRSRTKMIYPGMLDNTVGGTLASYEKPIDCIVRDAEEEAFLPEGYTRERVKACGTLSHSMAQTDDGEPGCQHQVEYLYGVEAEPEVVLKPNDGEAGEFSLMSLDEVRHALSAAGFKLKCATTWMAFLIRHDHVTAENEARLVEICARLHRKHDLFVVYFL